MYFVSKILKEEKAKFWLLNCSIAQFLRMIMKIMLEGEFSNAMMFTFCFASTLILNAFFLSYLIKGKTFFGQIVSTFHTKISTEMKYKITIIHSRLSLIDFCWALSCYPTKCKVETGLCIGPVKKSSNLHATQQKRKIFEISATNFL